MQGCILHCYKRFLFQIKNPEKKSIIVSTKISTSTIVFNIGNNKKLFLEHQISILEGFLKEHVTLKTGVMAAENSALHHRNKLHFIIY